MNANDIQLFTDAERAVISAAQNRLSLAQNALTISLETILQLRGIWSEAFVLPDGSGFQMIGDSQKTVVDIGKGA